MRLAQDGKIPNNKRKIEKISQIIMIASGKGGVGKSTISVALAEQLTAQGAKVGLVDTDIYGPSIPIMMGVNQKPTVENNKIIPLSNRGIKLMSIGFLTGAEGAIAWRGPMTTKAIHQLLSMVEWGGLDYLIIDTPPGTGDVHLSILENYYIDGVIMVTTPQKIATSDALKGIDLYQKFSVPILGIIENMSDIFSGANGAKIAEEHKIPLIAQVAFNKEISDKSDQGREIGYLVKNIIPAL
jgi:ATP-binding protein involved in chromosome partitioning